MTWEFATAGRILFGAGARHQLPEAVRALGRHALLVTGRHLAGDDGLPDIGRCTRVVVEGEPTVEIARAGVAAWREASCDVVIGIGGGSVLDAAKAIAALVTNSGEPLDYLEGIGRGRSLESTPAPCVAVPTSAGTGSEVTRNAVLGSPEHRRKASLRHPAMLPRLAIVDPELTLSLPPAVTASTGLDALTQLIEPYVSPRATPLTDALCLDGIARVARALRTAASATRATGALDATREGSANAAPTDTARAHANLAASGATRAGLAPADPTNPDPTDADATNAALTPLQARTDMSLASLLGGLALANAGLGVIHGFAAPIGGMFPAPHGAVCAALLPHGMTANLRALRARLRDHPAIDRYRRIAVAFTGDPAASADAGIGAVAALCADLAIPPLRAYGLRDEHVVEICCEAQRSSSMKANPIALLDDELQATLLAAL